MANDVDYNKWSKDSLIERLVQLEKELQSRPPPPAPPAPPSQAPASLAAEASSDAPAAGKPSDAAQPTPKKRKEKQKMDPSTKSFRYVALKLAYLGRNYGGFEYSSSGVLPSIEEELFKALTKTCLIFPEDERAVDFAGCEYSKCGRTDRGVSAFGQVIGLRLRSARPAPGQASSRRKKRAVEAQAQAQAQGAEVSEASAPPEGSDGKGEGEGAQGEAGDAMEMEMETEPSEPPFDPIRDEIDYPRVLNRVLPRDIRILAWCPEPPPGFSARYSCRERQYRYFFTQPAFQPSLPSPGQDTPGWLDIEAMRDAARRYEGEHDFRNFCKIDPAKNITNFRRGILESTIEEVPDVSSALPYLQGPPSSLGVERSGGGGQLPKVYCFKVRGTAFLWHQIRNMVSILFLVAQGLEKPELVDELLDVQSNPRRPVYVMADEVPLVLWDCLFPGAESEPEMQWIHVESDVFDPARPSANPNLSTTDGLWKLWREVKMDEILANRLLGIVARPLDYGAVPARQGASSMKLFEGGNSGRQAGRHVPVMKMKLMESPEEQSRKFAQRKGFASADDMVRQRLAKNEQAGTDRMDMNGGEQA